MNLEAFYAERPVLVTGADGFIGSHLVEQLVEWKADVSVFIRASSSGELRNIYHLADQITVYRGNLIDHASVRRALEPLSDKGEKPVVFHLGAQAHVGESWERPYDTVMSNIVGTLNLLQAIVDLDLDLHKLDVAGTSEEYGGVAPDASDNLPFDEGGELTLHELSPLHPHSVYATTKLGADFLTRNYHAAYGLPGTVTRMFNNFGPRQSPRYVTGTVITQALERDEVLLGYLEPKRDFCYVSDGVMGHLHVAAAGRPGEVYCYGYGESISIGDWASLILGVGEEEGHWGSGKRIQSTKDRYRPGESEVMQLKVEYTKLKEETGWVPQVTWEEGLRRTIEWYAENPSRWASMVDWR